ncbi:hypothetical protein Ancab_028736 [Ancistrocladus abbreviatus]
MKKRVKFGLFQIFRAFSSCKTQAVGDVINHQNLTFTPQNHQFISGPIEPSTSPKLRPANCPSMCRPRCPDTFDEMGRENCILPKDYSCPRRKISERNSLSLPDDVDGAGGTRCPPASPASPLNQYYFKLQSAVERGKSKKSKKKPKQRKTHLKSKKGEGFPCPFVSSSNDEEWFSSDDEREDETETPFSSKSVSFSPKSLSFSSDSEPNRPTQTQTQTQTQNRRKKPGARRRRSGKRNSELGLIPLQGKVKDSFAVLKRSSDPYSDFRTSMVEMIIERQIFEAQELEQLLQCFLSLNSAHHHRVIVLVFAEIWETLFSNSGSGV